ncbi:MAG: YtxH domain-containing protein [Nitrospiraceae bacterium]
MGNDRGCSLGSVGLAFVGGGLLGAAMALLLAPQSGRESRDQLRGYARRAGDNIHELTDTATRALDQVVDKGREFIKDKQGVVTEAIEAGRTAMQREHDRLAGSKKV